jgi:hypothetical protein
VPPCQPSARMQPVHTPRTGTGRRPSRMEGALTPRIMPTSSRPKVAIAGPRRARSAVPLPAPAPAPTHAASSGVGATGPRALPPLDYDEAPRSSKGACGSRLEVTRPGARKRAHRLPWFVLGIAFGALGAAFAGGGATGTMRTGRAWSADVLRSLETPGRAPSGAATLAFAPPASRPLAMAAPTLAPCPVDPGPDDPCAALLAPFSRDFPTVSVEDLPRVQPPPLRARVDSARHARVVASPSKVQSVVAPTATDQEVPAASGAINSDGDDPDDPPLRTTPPSPTQSPKPTDPPSTELPSARNEPS